MKKAELNFLHICDYASFGEGGKLNVVGIFESISTKTVPYTHPSMYIVSNTTIRKNGNYRQKIRIVDEKGKEIVDDMIIPIKVDIPSGKKQAKIAAVGQISGLKFERYGKFKVQVYLQDELVGERELEVVKLQP